MKEMLTGSRCSPLLRRAGLRFSILNAILILISASCLLAASAALAQTIAQPLYSGMWLPPEFIPAPFEGYPNEKPDQLNPPRSNGSHSVAIFLPRPKSEHSDKWIWVFIDGMSLHQSVDDAKQWMTMARGDNSMDYASASLGDESLVPEKRIRSYLGNDNIRYATVQGGFLIKENLKNERWPANAPTVWRRNLLVDPIRIGRITVGLRVEGNWREQVISGNRVTVRDTPTSEQLIQVAQQFVEAIRRYAKNEGWDAPVDDHPPIQHGAIPESGPQTTGILGNPVEINPNDSLSSADGFGINADGSGTVTLAVSTLTSLATAGLTALGAGLMMFGMGVKPNDVIDGVRELFTGATDTPPPAIDDDFEQWKRAYESRGWCYTEKDGIAEFEPGEGATNESGWTYSEERGGFAPPKNQGPQPESPPADASYKEEVRLLKEDLERQRDLLDRERLRFREYEKSGLEELLPGTRERIRQYEKLSDLNQSELERLNENRPTHTVEDNRDLKADANERLRSRGLINDLSEGDRKLETGSEVIAEREREIDQLEEEIQTIEQDALLDPESSSLEKKFLEQQEALLEDGYRVANPGYDAPNLVIREAIDATAFVIDQTGLGGVVVEDFKAIRCGDFAEIGQEKTQSFVNQLYGKKADEVIVDKVFVDVIRDDSLGGQVNQLLDVVAPKNHVANRVILPDGRRYILDYWEGNRGSNIRLVTEEQWLERWEGRLGEDMRYIGSDNDFVRGAQIKLMDQVEYLQKNQGSSTEEALEVFRQNQEKAINTSAIPSGTKERQLKQVETLIQSYRRSGRFHSEGIENYVQ